MTIIMVTISFQCHTIFILDFSAISTTRGTVTGQAISATENPWHPQKKDGFDSCPLTEGGSIFAMPRIKHYIVLF